MEMLKKIIKSIFFYPLLWVRRIMKIGFKLISVGFVILGIFSLGFSGDTFTKIDTVMFFGVGFAFFLIGFLYDQILFKLNPPDSTLSFDI